LGAYEFFFIYTNVWSIICPLEVRCLTPLSKIFQLLLLWRKLEYPEKSTDLSQVTDKLYHIMFHKSSNWNIFESGVKHLTSNGQMMDQTFVYVVNNIKHLWVIMWEPKIFFFSSAPNYWLYIFFRETEIVITPGMLR
jgi:hypothetical protein